MADSSVDIPSLTEEQQLALQQYTAVTDQEIDKAIPLLSRCQWNVQIAIARFFDGEPAEDPIAAAATEQAAPQDIRRQETLLNGFTSAPSSSSGSMRRVRIEPAPRIVPQPESQVSTQVPLVLAIVFAPFSLVYSLLGKWFRFMGWLFPFLPRTWGRLAASNINTPSARSSASGRRPLNPRDTAARFIREFEEEHGAHQLPFFESGYAQAFDLAKKNLQFLMVVLVSPEHDATSSFIRDTLLSPDVVSFIRDPANNIILWAGNVQDSEAYQVSSALSCTKFPFTGLIVHTPQVSSTAMGIAARIVGPTPPGQYLAKLKAAMRTHSEPLVRVRNQRAEQQATRNIRQQQDSAYERSLATDRERARKKKEEQEAKARQEKQAQQEQEAQQRYQANLAQWRKWRASSIPDEPPATAQDIVRISLRLPNAQRIVRRFDAAAHIEELYAFVECYDVLSPSSQEDSQAAHNADGATVKKPDDFNHQYAFQLVSPMPREVIDVESGGTIRERVGRNGNLIVEQMDGGDDDDEE